MKKCTNCHQFKLCDEFQKDCSRIDGYAYICKNCYNNRKSMKYKKNPDNKRQQGKNLYQCNLQDWKRYFINKHGDSPCCSLCNKLLQFFSGKQIHSVNWDHKDEKIYSLLRRPMVWLTKHQCNEENIKQWESFEFGILCSRCNLRLPAFDRVNWINQLLNYMEMNYEYKTG